MTVAHLSQSKQHPQSDPADGKFHNSEIDCRTGLGNLIEVTRAYFTSKRQQPVPKQALPVRPIPEAELHTPSITPQLYRLGHSSMLIRLDGELLLTDPVFSDRASPLQWLGPKRFHPLPIAVDKLPTIKAVIISHDHYDHLDKATIKAIDSKVERFVTPLGVGEHLRSWGVNPNKITELDWWQQAELGSIKLVATPAQHFSGRGLLDRDKTLWASWVIEGQQAKLFFSGDSGYFGGFKQIGELFGPFDLTMIETGAYNPLWSQIHMLPEQSVQAHLDLKGKAMLPIHNSTFDLALHDWHEPLERAFEASQSQGVKLVTPIMGEPVSITAPTIAHTWWREQVAGDSRQLVLAD